MACEDDDAVFLAGDLRDDVVHRKSSSGCIRRELVLFYLNALQVRHDVLLDLAMGFAADGTWAEGDDFAGVLVGLLSVDLGRGWFIRGRIVGSGIDGSRFGHRGLGLCLWLRLVAVAGGPQ